MAREDVLPQLFRSLMQKEGPPEETDNSIIQKMIVPQDSATLSETLTTSKVVVNTQQWGSGWNWGGGQWQ